MPTIIEKRRLRRAAAIAAIAFDAPDNCPDDDVMEDDGDPDDSPAIDWRLGEPALMFATGIALLAAGIGLSLAITSISLAVKFAGPVQ